MASIFTKRNWQPCLCQPIDLKLEIKNKTGGAKQKSGGAMAHPGLPLESPLSVSEHWAVEKSRTARGIDDWMSTGEDPGWGDRPTKTYTSDFIHHDFVQFGKQGWRYRTILSSSVLSQQCCEVSFIFTTVANSSWDLTTNDY